MFACLVRHAPVLAALALAAPAAFAQPAPYTLIGGSRPYHPPIYCPPVPCLPPTAPAPAATLPTTPTPTPTPSVPTPTEPAAPSPAPEAPSFAPETSAAVGGSTFAYGGYIDSAIIRSQIRLRYDSAYDNNRPDRAEFFYAKCGCNPGGRGPRELESRVDYQDISTYIEFAASNRLSGFIEVPVRFLNPDINDNTAGLSDITAGVRLGLIANPGQAYTFQLRAFAPTGDDDRGLGTGHASLEPAFLVFQKLTDRLYVEGEFRDWIPIGGTDFAGNVLRYGVGMAYNVAPCPERQFIAPVVEFVGWTVLDGKQTVFPTGVIESASGDTIVNAKLGVRAGTFTNSIYVGYGRALTGDVWYKDLIRVEYRRAF